MVVVYNIYIFDRHCECVFYTEWNRLNSPLSSDLHTRTSDSTRLSTDTGRPLVWPTNPLSTSHRHDSSRTLAMEEEAKLVYGAVFSTRNIINKLNSKDSSLG
ncbi:TRAPP complex subunit bet5, partial [Coemansia sp. RSA 1722]